LKKKLRKEKNLSFLIKMKKKCFLIISQKLKSFMNNKILENLEIENLKRLNFGMIFSKINSIKILFLLEII
jgi:hypothetical protein